MKKALFIFTLICFVNFSNSQDYDFKTVIDLEATDVISQGRTGTCWSFSASSFLESEIMRLTGKTIDISEMYNVRHTYPKKAWIYVMRQGKAQFSQGGLAHDVMNSINEFGLVPSYVYSGLKEGQEGHDHSKLVKELKKTLEVYLKDTKAYKTDWKQDIATILDNTIGNDVTTFNYEGVQYTPKSFLEITKIKPIDYVSITSFSHAPYYSEFVLNIPDNFSNGSFYNVPLNEMISIIDNALENGFTIELDCDVSEKTFSSKHGLAIIPEDGIASDFALLNAGKEMAISQEYRQQEFENYNTTDDHLMHITGMLKDQNGTTYYKVKNSWGKNPERTTNDGYIYMSEAYMRLKTISVMVHKDAVPKTVKEKFSSLN